jgi:hypothetical protein
MSSCSYQTVARPSGCRTEARLDTWLSEASNPWQKPHSPSKRLILPGGTGGSACPFVYPDLLPRAKSVETSLDAADTSVRATQASDGSAS